jgi:ribosomal protein L34
MTSAWLAAGPTWLSAGEAARAAGVSAGYLRRLIRQGTVEADRGDRGYAVSTDSVAALVARRREGRTQAPARCPMDRVRDGTARQLEAQFPGWTVTHGVCGWKAERPGCEPVRMKSSGGLESILERRRQQEREQVVDRLRAAGSC